MADSLEEMADKKSKSSLHSCSMRKNFTAPAATLFAETEILFSVRKKISQSARSVLLSGLRFGAFERDRDMCCKRN